MFEVVEMSYTNLRQISDSLIYKIAPFPPNTMEEGSCTNFTKPLIKSTAVLL